MMNDKETDMRVITDLGLVRVVSKGDPFQHSSDIHVERLLDGSWIQHQGFNSLSDDYAYTNARECAFDLVKTLAKEKSLLVT